LSDANYLDVNRDEGKSLCEDDHRRRRHRQGGDDGDDANADANADAAGGAMTTKMTSSRRLLLPPEKSGYLFKWQDRSIGWGGTKWALRFVRLDMHGQLSYYKTHDDVRPRYVLTLKNCAVRDEGSKINKRRRATSSSASAAVVSGIGGGGGTKSTSSSSPDDDIHDDDDDPHKHEAGSRFYVFSVHLRQRDVHDDHDHDHDIVPLLRFSTQSHAEKMQWIDVISQACAYCDSDEYATSVHRQQQQSASQHGDQHGKRHERGTLPALVFEAPPLPPPSYHDTSSGEYHHKGKLFRSKSTRKDAARTNVISYPPSKPMHRMASPSYLSTEGGGRENQNYRGFFNLLLIILVVSNFRLLLDTVSRHGFILAKIATLDIRFDSLPSLADSPFVCGLLIVQAFVVGAYVIEYTLSRRWLFERVGLALHFVNANSSLGVVVGIVWHRIEHPVVGAMLILQATITWLKLVSYVHANHDHRATSMSEKHGVSASTKNMLALVKDLDPEDVSISYPDNVTLWDMYYFWFAPTLTYQLAFPRAPFVRWTKVMTLSAHLFVSVTLVVFIAAQVIAPNLDMLVRDLEESRGRLRTHVIGDYLLKLSISSTYIWLLVFYGFFHCFLNLTAELLRFGDRGKSHGKVHGKRLIWSFLVYTNRSSLSHD
jgi:diacylglycerol O-acyltransferase-1